MSCEYSSNSSHLSISSLSLDVLFSLIVHQRQRLVLRKAEQSSAIVSSLFPAQVRDRMMEEANHVQGKRIKSVSPTDTFQTKTGSSLDSQLQGAGPIADLFPEATVLFCDIAGFTVSDCIAAFVELMTQKG